MFPNFEFTWLAEEIRRNLPNELNFLHEAQNMEVFSKTFEHLEFVKVIETVFEKKQTEWLVSIRLGPFCSQ